MKKKIIALVAASVLALSLTACGGDTNTGDTETSGGNDTTQTEETGGGSTAPEAGAAKVALVMPGNITDAGWNAAAYNGLKEAEEQYGIEAVYSEAVQAAEMESTIRDYAMRGYGLILCHGDDFSDAVSIIAPEFPDVYFAISNGTLVMDNVIGMDIKNEEQGYMAGYALGLATQDNIVGYVSSIEGLSMKRTEYGFMAGVEASNPDAEVVTAYIGSMDDAAKGKETTFSVFERGADCVFQYAQGAGVGVIQAAAEADKIVAVTTPAQVEMAPEQAALSCQNDMRANILTAIEAYINGEFGPGLEIMGDLSSGAFIISMINEDIYTPEQVAQIENQVALIKSGEVAVPLLAEQ